MIAKFLEWYNSIDGETKELLRRFIAHSMAQPSPSEYVKSVLKQELDKYGPSKA